LTLTCKLLNLKFGSQLPKDKRRALSNKLCHLLLNFIERCPRKFLYYPLRALME
jgi:hypothetical protein